MTAPARPAPPVVRVATVASTQAVVFRLASDGAPDRTVVVADHQSAGRGRRGRVWADAPGSSLLASILVRPRVPPALWPALSPTTAVAVAAALARVTGLVARLKWPNDVIAGGRKLAGILLESRAVPGDPLIAVGVGINLAQREFPPELGGRATSVALETGRVPDRDAVLQALLEEFDAWRARLEGAGFVAVRGRWQELAETIGQTVTIDGVTGVALGLDLDGALLVEEKGRARRIVAGEIAAGEPSAALRRRTADAARR